MRLSRTVDQADAPPSLLHRSTHRATILNLMSARAEALPRPKTAARRKSKKKSGSSPAYMLWAPLVVGLAATWFAVRYAEILPLLGPAGLLRLRLMAPLAMLAHQPELGMAEITADSVAQGLLYVQFPIYGMLLGLIWRVAGFARAAGIVVLVHAMAVAAVLVLSQL